MTRYVAPTEKMVRYVRNLARDRVYHGLGDSSDDRVARLDAWLEAKDLDKFQVMELIDRLKDAPLDTQDPNTVGPGVYRRNGDVFVVQLNKDKTRVYAKRLVQSADRVLDVDGETIVKADFEYAPGALQTLRPEDQLTLEQGREYLVRYTHCMICGRPLKAARSVIDTIGPVCRKMFKDEDDGPPQLDDDEVDRILAALGGGS